MALVQSKSIPLGSTMPTFTLKDTSGTDIRLDDVQGKAGTLIVFTCNHCPYALALWPRFITLANQIEQSGITTLFINPNINPNYPDDSPDEMKKKVVEWQIPGHYLIDETQSVAQDYAAECTPDIYLIDAERKLLYHGRVDDNWKDPAAVTSHDLKTAINLYLAGNDIPTQQIPSMGCSIKWVNAQ